MELDIDFGNVQEFEPLPTGNYSVTIEDAQLKTTKKDKSKYNLVCKYRVNGGEEDGKSLTDWIYIDPENPFGLKKFTDAVFGEQETLRIDEQFLTDLAGMTVGITVEESEYDGKPSCNVVAYFQA